MQGENLSSTSLRSSTLLLDDEDSDYDDVSTEVQCCSPNSTTSRVGDSDDSNAEDELEPDVELQPDGNTETDDVSAYCIYICMMWIRPQEHVWRFSIINGDSENAT